MILQVLVELKIEAIIMGYNAELGMTACYTTFLIVVLLLDIRADKFIENVELCVIKSYFHEQGKIRFNGVEIHAGYAYDLVFHFGKIEEVGVEVNIVDCSVIII